MATYLRDSDHFFFFILFSIFLSILLTVLALILNVRRNDPEKLSAYECGFNPFEDARVVFDVQFYLIALLFVLFDIEIVLLLPAIFCLYKITFFACVSISVFLFILALGFCYEWRKRALVF